ncbi:MAG: hypothetical protein CSA45_04165 [Gammaproteobacteria bacterium]|nr:MAG: hypothetical protein CSA45_04165 [Gammaproteobacteria bacterium]
MQIIYLVVSFPDDAVINKILSQLNDDLSHRHAVTQCFFYSDAVAIGAVQCYSHQTKILLNSLDEHHIPLRLCSAAFQRRHYQLNSTVKQALTFQGLGQFINEVAQSDNIRIF